MGYPRMVVPEMGGPEEGDIQRGGYLRIGLFEEGDTCSHWLISSVCGSAALTLPGFSPERFNGLGGI